MKKISTLAVALMTLGSLVTPAQADVVPTSTLPSGYYKIKSKKEAATHLKKYVFNDFTVTGNDNNVSLMSATDGDTNNYLWKITNDGKSAHKYGTDDVYKGVAYWNNTDNETTRWVLTKVDVDAKAYTVSVVTTSTSTTKPYITRTLTDGTKEYAFNSGFFISDADLDKASLTASTLEGYETPEFTVDNTEKTITAYYAKFDDLTALITSANGLLNTRGIGYPLSTSDAYNQFAEAIRKASGITAESSAKDCAEAYTVLQDAITNYRSTKTDIQMPEDGKVYRIYAKWADGTKVYAVNDPTKKVGSQYRTTGTSTPPSDNSAFWVMQKVGDYYNIVSASADNLFTYMNQDNSAQISSQIITKVSGLRFGQLNIAPKANTDQHIVMAKNGSKMGYFTGKSIENDASWSTEWFFEEVPTSEFAGQTVNFAASADGHCYATLNLPYASTLPTGVTAYTAAVEGSTVNLAEYKAAGDVLPANTPVLLTATTPGEKTFAPAAYVAADNKTGFKGTLAATAVNAANTYILSQKDGKVKFFALDETNNTINANKAYLVVFGGAAQALNFNFGNTTGIQNAAVEGVNANAPLFDLSGRRVVKAVKGGIYIQNGKKFVK